MSKTNIHATCISYRDNGILLIGPSGSGKSDLALRMMMNKGAQLVADDRTDVEEKFGRLRATCPENIRGMMEVRGIGLCRFEPCPSVFVELGNIQNTFDQRRLVMDSNRQALAKWLMEGFLKDFKGRK